MFNKIFNASNSNEKSYYPTAASFLTGFDSSYTGNFNVIEIFKSYFENAPVFIATNRVAGPAASIAPLVKDTKTDEFIDHPLDQLMKNPNPMTSGTLFRKQCYAYYIMTGNIYIEVTKTNIGGSRPSELSVLNPLYMNIQYGSTDGYPSKYSYTGVNGKEVIFNRDGNSYINAMGNEILHLRNFNPNFSSDNFAGVSFFIGCQLEISQYTLASIHNNSLLKNQARPSGMMTYKGSEILGDDQINGIRQELQDKFKGAANAGASGFLPGDFDWIQLSQSVKDMDFENLKKSTEQACFKALNYPLALISPDQMTLSNVSEAKYEVFDGAVLPIVKTVNEFLTNKLLPMYRSNQIKNKSSLVITYDESDIEVLEERKINNATKVYASGLITRNEGRADIGREGEPGGDTFYQPNNLVPVGTDTYTEDNREAPKKSLEMQEYIRIMSQSKNSNGSARYSPQEIELKANNYFKNG